MAGAYPCSGRTFYPFYSTDKCNFKTSHQKVCPNADLLSSQSTLSYTSIFFSKMYIRIVYSTYLQGSLKTQQKSCFSQFVYKQHHRRMGPNYSVRSFCVKIVPEKQGRKILLSPYGLKHKPRPDRGTVVGEGSRDLLNMSEDWKNVDFTGFGCASRKKNRKASGKWMRMSFPTDKRPSE